MYPPFENSTTRIAIIRTYETQNHLAHRTLVCILYQSIKKLSALMSETLRTSETLDDVVLFMKISVTSVFEFEGPEGPKLTDLYHLKSRKNCFQ